MKEICFVPCCNNTSENAPQKQFIFVPRRDDIRNKWFEVVGVPIVTTKKYCCEDHFNLQDDCLAFEDSKQNPMLRMRVKKTVVPHLHLVIPKIDERSQLDSPVPSLSSPLTQSESDEEPSSCHSELKMDSYASSASFSPSRLKDASPMECDLNRVKEESNFEAMSYNREKALLEKDPRLYLGLEPGVFEIVSIISQYGGLVERNIFILLKKIRLNDSYRRLGYDFGLSESQISLIFAETIGPVADVMKHFIYWPSNRHIKQFLPISFRLNYSLVTSIIDCFEVAIEKPTCAIQQALTWSSYKNANTMKYLISATPYGLINFISEGCGGRTSDLVITETCGFLKCVPHGTAVMADRGFKHLGALLTTINVKLIKPPSVPTGSQLSAEQIVESCNISTLRIHIERVISRIQNFSFLSAHGGLDIHLLPYLDNAVIIACGLINFQPELGYNYN